MKYKNYIKATDYEKASKLIDEDSDIAEQINIMIRQQGLARFFRILISRNCHLKFWKSCKL